MFSLALADSGGLPQQAQVASCSILLLYMQCLKREWIDIQIVTLYGVKNAHYIGVIN